LSEWRFSLASLAPSMPQNLRLGFLVFSGHGSVVARNPRILESNESTPKGPGLFITSLVFRVLSLEE
jgi:hypothetical protein